MEKRKKILSGVGFLALMGASYFAYEHHTYVSTDNAQIEGHFVMLAAKVSGFVRTVNVEEGSRVKKGDVLVEIDQRDFDNNVDQIQGELTSLQAKLNEAEKNFHRLSSLFSSGAVTQQQFEQASAGYKEVKAKYEAVSAQVAQSKLNLQYTKITAPADGIIARKSVEPGQLANPGIPLIGFVSLEKRWIIANFKETDLPGIRLGNEAYIDVDAIPSREFKGKVLSISPATGATFTLLPPDNATGNFTKVVQRVPVKIEFENLNPQDIEILRAGLSANVKVRRK